jgi:hypothetical protein
MAMIYPTYPVPAIETLLNTFTPSHFGFQQRHRLFITLMETQLSRISVQDADRMCIYTAIIGLIVATATGFEASDYFKIHVIDEQTGRGVPLVELRTVNDLRFFTDSSGVVAFQEPGLMNKTVFFHVSSHGYEFRKDSFGYRGQKLKVVAGEQATLSINRINIAERLYRVTGGGIYRDSVLVGESSPIQHPVLNGLVLGSDSVVNTVYRGKIFWFWGDTNRPSYPLGNFHVPGATSDLPADGGLDPAIGDRKSVV